jgi:hypothetical protein
MRSNTSRAARLTALPSLGTASASSSAPSATALFLHHQRRTYAAKANARKCGEFKTDMFGHHTIKVDDGHLLVLPSTRTLNPFARPSVYQVDTTKDEWHWEEKSVSAPFPQTGPRGHLFGQQLIVAGTLTTLGPLKRKGMVTLDMSTALLISCSATRLSSAFHYRFQSSCNVVFAWRAEDFTTSRVTMLDPASQKATKTVNMTNFVSEATHNPDKVWFFGENYLNAKNESAACEVMVWNKGTTSPRSHATRTIAHAHDTQHACAHAYDTSRSLRTCGSCR